MTQLITQQRVRRRAHKPVGRKGKHELGSAQINISSMFRMLNLKKIFKPRYLYVSGVAFVSLFVLFFASSVISHGMVVEVDDVQLLPRDDGIDSLVNDYLSFGIAAEGIDEEIFLDSNILMQESPHVYTVRPGDTVSEIAGEFGVRMDTIISYNGIKDVRRLQAGIEIRIPARDGVLYQVKAQDSLAGIAERFNVDLNPILDANNIQSSIIHVGDTLFIPQAAMDDVEYRSSLGTLFIWPIRGNITSGFEMRNDPFTGVRRMHNGLDIAGDMGTSVKASNHGKVTTAAESRTFGKYVVLSHVGGFQTLYAHLSSWNVRKGQWVDQYSTIGKVGNTGRSTGPHLHFSIYKNQVPLDPIKFLY